MADDKRSQARDLWEQSKGALSLREIAEQLEVPTPTIKSWKQRDGWGKDARMQTDASGAKDASRKRQERANRRAAETVEANEELTDREKDFCLAFIQAPNASQAAMMTGRYTTYGAARQSAYEMMQKPAVIEEIKQLKIMKKSAMLADADDVIELHMRIAFADIKQFVDFGQEEVPVMNMFGPVTVKNPITGVEEPLTKIVNVVRFKDSAVVDGAVLSEVKQNGDGASVKLADRQKSLAFLERHFDLNPMDKHKKAYDNARLALEGRQVKVQEDKLHGLSSDIDTIKAGLQELMGIIQSPVPNRRLDDE